MAVRSYAALLRGVSPMNAKMPQLKKAFESCGFTNVKTILSSGNVVFSARSASEASLERKAEKAMTETMGRTFMTIVRPIDALRTIVDSEPYSRFKLEPKSKRVVTFLRRPPKTRLSLPIELHGARILAMKGSEVFIAYVPSPRGAAFMTLIEKTFGKDVTTRTWDTVNKIVNADPSRKLSEPSPRRRRRRE